MMTAQYKRRALLFQRYLTLQDEYYALKEVCSEQERTLEELGGQLSSAKLAAAELREAADDAQRRQQQQLALQEGSVTWTNDRLVTQCKGCSREFNMTRRKVIKLFNCSPRLRNPSLSIYIYIYSIYIYLSLFLFSLLSAYFSLQSSIRARFRGPRNPWITSCPLSHTVPPELPFAELARAENPAESAAHRT